MLNFYLISHSLSHSHAVMVPRRRISVLEQIARMHGNNACPVQSLSYGTCALIANHWVSYPLSMILAHTMHLSAVQNILQRREFAEYCRIRITTQHKWYNLLAPPQADHHQCYKLNTTGLLSSEPKAFSPKHKAPYRHSSECSLLQSCTSTCTGPDHSPPLYHPRASTTSMEPCQKCCTNGCVPLCSKARCSAPADAVPVEGAWEDS